MQSTQTFYRKDKQGHPLQITITAVDTPEYDDVAQFIALEWQALGVQTNIKLIRKNEIRREILKSHNFQILLYGEVIGADPDLFPFWHSSQIDYPGLNLAQFSDRNADKLLEDARKTTDDAERVELYKKFQNILAEQVPAIFLYSPSYSYLINKEIKGIEFNRLVTPADRFNNLSAWYIKTKWIWK
jgi:peptide/nickel transport system substrate-binding protein